MNLESLNDQIHKYIRPNTFPLAIKYLKSVDEAPHGTKFPKKDLQIEIMLCQAFSMARRYGWTVGITKQDLKCGTSIVILGFAEAPLEYYEGKFSITPQNQAPEIRSIRLKVMSRLPLHQYECMIVSPLFKTTFDPDLIVVYGSGAQVLRLLQGHLFNRGGYMQFESAGVVSCADTLVTPYLQNRCQVVLPGNGERINGHVDESELVFSAPAAMFEEIVQGLELSHKGGQRYPVPYYARHEPQIPKEGYMELVDLLKR